MTYNHKLINDLEWAIGSPRLTTTAPYNDVHIVTEQWFTEQLNQHGSLLLDQDKSPHLIQTYLSTMPKFRLGHYFENLIAYWFEIHPNYEILHKNLVITSKKQTIGEFDFIIRETPSNKVIHIEVAVKFFLEVLSNNKTHWLGPNLIDSLDKKYKKLTEKQILLSKRQEAQEKLKDLGIKIDEQWIFLKGRLFGNSSNTHFNNIWMKLEYFENFNNSGNSKWVILEKTHWLSEISNLEYNFLPSEIYSKNGLIKKLNKDLYHSPICIAEIINDNEINRYFIAPDDWLERALQSLD